MLKKIVVLAVAFGLSNLALANPGYQLGWTDGKASSGPSITTVKVKNLSEKTVCAFAKVLPSALSSDDIAAFGSDCLVANLSDEIAPDQEIEFDLTEVALEPGDYVVGFGAQACPLPRAIKTSDPLPDEAIAAVRYIHVK